VYQIQHELRQAKPDLLELITPINHLDMQLRNVYHAAKGQFDEVIVLGKQGHAVDEMRNQLVQLRQSWQAAFGSVTPAKSFSPPERGIRTPQSTYYRPLLEALIELGGKAEPKAVLPQVYTKVKHLLTDYDHEQLPSDPRKIRWRTATRFASHELRVQGLLTNSPHGIWEISAAGRRFVAETRLAD
jgi:restriction system protein